MCVRQAWDVFLFRLTLEPSQADVHLASVVDDAISRPFGTGG